MLTPRRQTIIITRITVPTTDRPNGGGGGGGLIRTTKTRPRQRVRNDRTSYARGVVCVVMAGTGI